MRSDRKSTSNPLLQPYETIKSMFDPSRDLFWVYFILVVDAFLFWGIVIAIEKAEAPVQRYMTRMRQRGVETSSEGAGSALSVQHPPKPASVSDVTMNVVSAKSGEFNRSPDPMVNEERKGVESGENKSSLLINGIEQKFVMQNGNINHAVKGVHLGVSKGEVFGLLGMNGAAKTTLLHSIQGKHVPTSGDCTIEGISAVTSIDEARRKFGVCPQHDVLWEHCSSREHLVAFANIRGVPNDKIYPLVDDLLKRLDVAHKANALSKTLSGGQKRKLSIAMAVIGNPDCVFLDEPTTGLDPNTRRFVWDYIMELKKDRVVVLTTHSMEEADALCSRIGIMVNGELKTLGTPQQMKAAYGNGYRISLEIGGEVSEGNEGEVTRETNIFEEGGGEISETIKEKYGAESVVFDRIASSSSNRVYEIKKSDLNLGEFFGFLEENREKFSLLDYSINQSNLDQVFKNFAKYQEPEEVQR